MKFLRFPALILIGFLLLFLQTAFTWPASIWATHRQKNIAYIPVNSRSFDETRHRLDVYTSNTPSNTLRPVVVFIHGGNWDSGNKNWYSFIGRRLAKQGVVAVLINYRLAPSVQVPAMADDAARAVRWVTQRIKEYGGDPARIFVMGHSAGGGLAALLATDNSLFTRLGMLQNPIKGAILDDPAGVDMFDYLQKKEYPGDEKYLVPFGTDPVIWKQVSARYYVSPTTPPMLVYVGGRTYPSIRNSSELFAKQLQEAGVKNTFKVIPRKKHIGMATQLFWKKNEIYQDLLQMVGAVKP